MYGIYIYVNRFYIPLAFLPLKSFECYRAMWNFICHLCTNKIQKDFTPSSVHLDFEIVAHKAFLNVFPYSEIKGCKFHLGQSWNRKINSLSDLKKLPFLPSNEMEDAHFDFNFTDLFEFSDYMFNNYIIE